MKGVKEMMSAAALRFGFCCHSSAKSSSERVVKMEQHHGREEN